MILILLVFQPASCINMFGWQGYLNFMGNEFAHPDCVDLPSQDNGIGLSHGAKCFV